MTRGTIAIMGSGETAPTMTKVHRQLLTRYDQVNAVNLDTPYAFQLNVPQMSEKLETYFMTSLQQPITTLHLARRDGGADLDRELVIGQLAESHYVFAGPGSPSYALEQWNRMEFVDALNGVLQRGGTLCFSSAAACTLGVAAAPIYEIYKVGTPPKWLEGLNVLGRYGIDCAVIPHYDNGEGENYDTRRCYLGEVRLTALIQQLPPTTSVLGVDEHTALVINLDEQSLEVIGRGAAYWRGVGDQSVTLESGRTYPLTTISSATLKPVGSPVTRESHELPDDLVELGRIALAQHELAPQAVAQLIKLATSTSQRVDGDAPLVSLVSQLRSDLRRRGEYQLADELRDILLECGFPVNDGPVNKSSAKVQ